MIDLTGMVGAFSFAGIDSDGFNLVCKSVSRPLLPPAKTKRVDLAQASGAFDFPGLEYSMRPITMRITYIGDDYTELRSRARSIASWLGNGSEDWAPLVINDEPDKYYLAKVTSEVGLETLFESGTADINFECQPFAYSMVDEVVVNNGTFINPGTRRIDIFSPQGSLFEIDLTGSSMTLNGRTIGYSGGGSVRLDCIEMTAYNGPNNVFAALTGDTDKFFVIQPGLNTISASGSFRLTYRPLWY
jgi:predicted phage tail component-like protein